MKNEIFEYIKATPTATFVNLSDAIAGFNGEFGMYSVDFPNIVLWPSISEEAIQALSELMNEGKIQIDGASEASYLIDGQLPTLPVARTLRNYKRPHWLPVCFSEKTPPKIGRATKKLKN